MSKLLEAAIVAEDCHKELEHKYKSKRIQTSTPSASKGKKKEDVFIIQTLKTPRKAQDPKDEAARKEEYERRKNVKYSFDENIEDIFRTLLEHGKLELTPFKRLSQEGRTDDPNYYHYHRMISHPLRECFALKEKVQDMLTRGIIQLDKKCDFASVNMVAFGSFAPTNIKPFMPKGVEFRLISEVKNEDGLIPVTTSSGEKIWVHLDLINNEDWEMVKTKPTSKERRKMKNRFATPTKQLRHSL